ncbi:Cytochrome P450 2B6 [Tupaia chinensis]|uniref:Cytochrome P450 2B6 n=1 Tax=Tupaia chinensis TaxID=246437 RepID=L9LCF4_TUPCH|nr:Cytochrome P450 2B6 [Tupaia chinensis]
MREALVDQGEAFSGRGLITITDSIFQGTGVFFTSGKSWKVLWQFCMTTMKDFGMGKHSIEERIKEEVQCLVKELQKYQGAYLDPTFLFRSISVNIVCSIIFGERFHYLDPKFLQLLNLLKDTFIIFSSFYAQVFELLSGILKHFPGPQIRMYSNIQEMKALIAESIERHQETLDPSAPQDFIDAFLICMDKARARLDWGCVGKKAMDMVQTH